MLLLLKQAETALAQGQLDEALSLLRPANVRSHRAGQKLIGQLVEALVHRGQKHLAAGRFVQANEDARNAQFMGGNQPEIAALQSAILTAMEFDQQANRHKAQQLAAARQQVDDGRLAIGEKWLADGSLHGSAAVQLMREIDVKKSTLEESLQSAADALDRHDLPAAVRQIGIARNANAGDSRIEALSIRAGEAIKEQLVAAFDAGRMDRVDPLIAQLAALRGETADVQHWRRGLEQCRAAWQAIDRGQPGKAAEILRRVAIVFESAKWIEPILKHLKQADDAMSELRAGPLSLIESAGGELPALATPIITPAKHGQDARGTGVPMRFLLRVDGVGSFSVFRQPSVTVGPVSSSQMPDVGLLADANLPIATIDRQDDEYFIRGSGVAVNDRAGSGKLLSSGDRISLSPRCRMNFLLPSAASATAVLDLSGSRHVRSDVRRIILLDRDIILGAGSATHIRVEQAQANCILHLRDGRLLVESPQPVEVNGAPMDRIMGIPMNAHVKTGNISFVVSTD